MRKTFHDTVIERRHGNLHYKGENVELWNIHKVKRYYIDRHVQCELLKFT